MKKHEIMKKKISELDGELYNLKKELFKLNSASLAGEDSLKKKAKVKGFKKNIARIKTRLNQK